MFWRSETSHVCCCGRAAAWGPSLGRMSRGPGRSESLESWICCYASPICFLQPGQEWKMLLFCLNHEYIKLNTNLTNISPKFILVFACLDQDLQLITLMGVDILLVADVNGNRPSMITLSFLLDVILTLASICRFKKIYLSLLMVMIMMVEY